MAAAACSSAVERKRQVVDILIEDDARDSEKDLGSLFTRGARLDTTASPGYRTRARIVRDVAENLRRLDPSRRERGSWRPACHGCAASG